MRNSNLKTKKAEKTVQKSSFKLVVSGSINFRHKKLGFKFKISIQFFRKWNVTFFVAFFFGGGRGLCRNFSDILSSNLPNN